MLVEEEHTDTGETPRARGHDSGLRIPCFSTGLSIETRDYGGTAHQPPRTGHYSLTRLPSGVCTPANQQMTELLSSSERQAAHVVLANGSSRPDPLTEVLGIQAPHLLRSCASILCDFRLAFDSLARSIRSEHNF